MNLNPKPATKTKSKIMQPSDATTYGKTFHQRWGTWLAAAVAACGLNLLLFMLMPHLLHQAPDKPAFASLIPQVNVIRVKRPETPAVRKQPKPPQPPKPKPARRFQPRHKLQVATRLRLPFEINPRLPAGPNTLELPPLESAPLNCSLGQGIFEIGQLDAPLTVIARMPPVYPLAAKRRGIQGWVKVKFLVNEQGQVGQVQVVAAEPEGIFEQSVIRCVSAWRFRPPTVEGIPVKTWVATKIRFELE